MARSYHKINISETQQEFIRLLDDYEVNIFSIENIEIVLHKKFTDLNVIVENLVNRGFLCRLERGKYCRHNFSDEMVIGTFIAKQGEGAVAYWTALNRYGLTEQFSNTVFIQAPFAKKDTTVLGVSYKFIKIAASKRTGVVKEGYGNYSFLITDVEKTIVDCFDLPQYSGGYAELIRAFSNAKLNSDKMIEYCNAIHNIAATKRMGFLAELLDKKGLKSFIKYAKKCVNEKYNLFSPFIGEEGEFVNEWRLRLNMSRENILNICNQQY